MFVLSKNHFDRLTRGFAHRKWRGGSATVGEKKAVVSEEETATATTTLLDLGAGDGRPTLAMADGFDRVLATEASRPMQRLLADKGFRVVDIEDWVQPAEYDLIRKDSPPM